MTRNKSIILASTIVLTILILDQIIKIWVKTSMFIGQDTRVFGDWFMLHFTENEGMAFGMKFGGKTGKFLLTSFRLLAVGALGWYIHKNATKNPPVIFVVCLSLILAGAAGNTVDSLFYGLIFSDSTPWMLATSFPEGGGYAPLFFGKVVDMFYAPIIHTTLPSWIPFKGGDEFIFFRPVFNLADSAISVGVVIMLLFYRKFWKDL
ncbi:MAG: lipoprotein signal peptidase [Bacteroidales bacterium]|nr:lipoprotein signal peptidase [Bacteroidales bacterium]